MRNADLGIIDVAWDRKDKRWEVHAQPFQGKTGEEKKIKSQFDEALETPETEEAPLMNLRLLSMLGLLTVAGVAPSQDAPASSESAAPSQGETATEDTPSASEAPAGSSEESPDAAASADAAQESRDPEHVAFEETMARFRAVAEAYNQEVTDVIKRRRNARLERLNIDFEEKMAAIEARMGIRRQQAIEAFERFVKRYPNDAVYTPPAMFRLAELHYEEAKQANLIAEERYEEQMELFNDGKLSEEPQPPKWI